MQPSSQSLKVVPINYILWLHFFHLLKSILRMDPEMNKCYRVTQSMSKVWTEQPKPKRPLQAYIKMSEVSDTDTLMFLKIQSSEQQLWYCLTGRLLEMLVSHTNINWAKLAMTAAAAKSLQSCPTLCDPIDGSPPGSPVPGILQARTPEWVAISFFNAWN